MRFLYKYSDLIISNSIECKNQLINQLSISEDRVVSIPNAHRIKKFKVKSCHLNCQKSMLFQSVD